jgi:Ser/Thr protein kinase RdoA (MazF antagonist)
VALLHRSEHMSEVLGLRLADGREIAVKSRPDQDGREATCVEIQRFLALQGFPCASPLTGVTVHEGLAVHAEQWRPGGEMRRGDDTGTAAAFAVLLAELVTLAEGVEVGGAAPGHADWESQNLRWHGDRPWAVHDWDSLAWLPEAAIAGAACGAFASYAEPTLAPIASSEAFLDAYQRVRRPFTAEELEVAWAASLWPALHNARGEALWDTPPVAITAVREQGAARLARAGA